MIIIFNVQTEVKDGDGDRRRWKNRNESRKESGKREKLLFWVHFYQSPPYFYKYHKITSIIFLSSTSSSPVMTLVFQPCRKQKKKIIIITRERHERKQTEKAANVSYERPRVPPRPRVNVMNDVVVSKLSTRTVVLKSLEAPSQKKGALLSETKNRSFLFT